MNYHFKLFSYACPHVFVKQQLHNTIIFGILLSAEVKCPDIWNWVIQTDRHMSLPTLYLSSQVCWIAQIGDARLNGLFLLIFYSILQLLWHVLACSSWKPVYFKHQSGCFSVGGSEGRAFSPVCFSGINTNRHRWDKQGKSSRLHFCPLRHLQDNMALLKCVVRNIFVCCLQSTDSLTLHFESKQFICTFFLCSRIKTNWYIHTFLIDTVEHLVVGSPFENTVPRDHVQQTESYNGKLVKLWKMWFLLVKIRYFFISYIWVKSGQQKHLFLFL